MTDLPVGYRFNIFSGHYGSGKSEVSVNFAILLARSFRTAIVDFDIINPYFRTAGAKAELEKQGVRVITPVYANTNVDVPALPAEISSLFDDAGIKAVFDAGGDSAGAKAVSRYREEFIPEQTAHFFVFNLRRPLTSSVPKILDAYNSIRESARVPFTAIVNNTNLLSETGETDLLEGLEAAVEFSRLVSLPVAFNTYLGDFRAVSKFTLRSEDLGIPVFFISKHILMP